MKPPWQAVSHFAWLYRLNEADAKEALERLNDFVVEWNNEAAQLDPVMSRCESPVERLFILGMSMACCHVAGFDDAPGMFWSFDGKLCGYLFGQVELESGGRKIRPDFLLKTDVARIYVEIDGHEFHASTRQQVARDRQRERAIAEGGDIVIRFTGSEVTKDPKGCAEQAMRIVEKLSRRVA